MDEVVVADQGPDFEVAVAAAVGEVGGADQGQAVVHDDALGVHAVRREGAAALGGRPVVEQLRRQAAAGPAHLEERLRGAPGEVPQERPGV